MDKSFYTVQVKDIYKTTVDSVVITLDIPEELQATFQHKQGQYLTFKKVIDGEEIRRSYSLCSAPIEDAWRIAVKKISDGRFSSFANDVLKKGDQLEVMPPQGKFFTEVDTAQEKNYVAFAAGSGITPILSIIKTHLELEPQSTFKLFYVNRAVSSIMLKEEIEGLKNKYFERFQVFHFLTREERSAPIFNGRLNNEKLDFITDRLFSPDQIDDYFICGPNEMIFLVQEYLEKKKVDKKKIHFELFNTPTAVTNKRTKKAPTTGDLQTVIKIKEGDVYQTVHIQRGSMSILDAALEQNIDLPYACKGGVCCTCKAKLIKGKIDQQVIYGLEQEEIDAGFILTCMSLPLSEEVEVDFDAYN